jgi:protein phosphatase
VADGMGGHASGEVASRMAVDTLREFFLNTADDPERTWPYKMDRSKAYEENRLITGIKLANLRIYETAQRDIRKRGMGTTIVAIFTVEDGLYVANVGDSRVYLIRDGVIEQLTEDHSLLNDYIKMKRLTPEEIANFPHKNVIVRALGMKETVKVDTRFHSPRADDTILLCSDGLSGPVSDEQMLEVVMQAPDLKTAARNLIDKANENGGPDNITCVLTRRASDACILPHLRHKADRFASVVKMCFGCLSAPSPAFAVRFPREKLPKPTILVRLQQP